MALPVIADAERLTVYNPSPASAGPFDVGFPLAALADIAVYLDDVLLDPADYTVAGDLGEYHLYEAAEVTLDTAFEGEVKILGKRSPRRDEQFAEGVGVTPRLMNISANRFAIEARELFDAWTRDQIGAALSLGYVLGSRQIFTTAGSFTWTKPGGCRAVLALVQAGGGSGAGAADTTGTDVSLGTGGAAGGWSQKWIVAPGATEAVTVGAGGAAAAAGVNGTAGGTSSFGSHCSATGGGAGIAVATGSGAAIVGGGAAGTGTGGDLNGTGSPGGKGFRLSGTVAAAGLGGDSHFSGGGDSFQSGATNGGAGKLGAGGGGGIDEATGGGATGGAGGDGFILVWEFY